MSKKFTLTLTIEGESLQEIDDQLVQAAGERLMVRMVNTPTLNGEPLVATESTQKPEVPVENQSE